MKNKDEERKPGEVNWDRISHETLETMASMTEGLKDNLPDPQSESVQEREDAEFMEGFQSALAKARGTAWYRHSVPEDHSDPNQTQHVQPPQTQTLKPQ